ncbi:hypothetical protein BV61_07495 [Candidatus Synechococcus spongiarum LMB bulk15M]|uniref:Type I restriction enzyme R protein N-terminal domain-containing protein n=1 Tax=Candidatus Synechococcus spongiarum LMB bulk15M TaxID=1943582 RepID=A0A1T1C7P0_9SYNE|nr:hypothetical protein BV61_07495 [Candidatus Synechococcus spongiarum LMB bulk15M]
MITCLRIRTMPMPFGDLINVIETIRRRIEAHRQSLQQNETRTRTALIDPLLTALGWDVSDPGLVTPEYNVGQGRADYALINGSDIIPAAIVEAKKLNYALKNDERMQMLNYANARGVRYAAVTDGNIWELYEVFKQAPLEGRRRLSVKITSTPAHQLALQLLLLWRPNLASGGPVAAQEPVLGTRREPATTEAFHQPVDTSSAQTSSAPPPAMTHQPRQRRSSSRIVQYCVDGENWIQCNNAILLMISIVQWCAQQHLNGAGDYYDKLSRTYARRGQPILIREIVTGKQKTCYSREEVNGWYIFRNLPNQEKRKMIDKILRACIRQDGTSPVPDQDLQVKLSNG